MKVLMGRLATAVMLMAATGAAAQAPPPEPVVVPSFRWLALPTAEQIQGYYPAVALDDEIEGNVELTCAVWDVAGHLQCQIVKETPVNCGTEVDINKPLRDQDGRFIGYDKLLDADGQPVPRPCGFGAAGVRIMEKFAQADTEGGAVPIGASRKVVFGFRLS